MPANSAKRVLLYRFDRLPVEGIVDTSAYLLDAGIEVMTTAGVVQVVPYNEAKAVCFASEGSREDLFATNNLFERRPKLPGLWTRFRLRDGDWLEGVLSHNLLEWPAPGFLLTPPKAGVTRQRVFLPRMAVVETELMGVVGMQTPRPRRSAKKLVGGEIQLRIFDQ